MDLDDAERLLARARQREEEMEKESCYLADSVMKDVDLADNIENVISNTVSDFTKREATNEHSLYPVEQLKRLSEGFQENAVDQNQLKESKNVNIGNLPMESENVKEVPKRKSIFSDLAANIDNFEVDLKPKVKTSKTRTASGEMKSNQLFTSNANHYASLAINKSPKKFAGITEKCKENITNVSANTAKVAEVIIEQPEREEMTNAKPGDICSSTNDEYLMVVSHTEFGDDEKHLSGPLESTTLLNSSPSSNSDGQDSKMKKFFEEPSPIPKVNEKMDTSTNQYINFQLRSDRRRDIIDEITAAADIATKEQKDLTSSSGRAKELASKLEEKVKNDNSSRPTFLSSTSKTESATSKARNTDNIHIHYRLNVPGSRAKTRRVTPMIDTTPTNVKSLRNRWEVSSSTGAPLHPDQDEDDLLEAARRMSRAIKQSNKWRQRPVSLYSSSDTAHDCCEVNTSVNCLLTTKDTSPRSDLTVNPSTVEIIKEDDKCKKRLNTAEDDEEKEDISGSEKKIKRDDKDDTKLSGQLGEALGAFEFLNEASTQNSSLLSSILDNTLEVEHATEQQKDLEVKKNDSEELALVHSVSFYRKKKKELKCTGETTVLGQFTTSPPRGSVVESTSPSKQLTDAQRFAKEKERLEREIRVQDEQIAQASKALRYCRNNLEFRSSRTEVDAQRALLISKESRRALQSAYDKLVKNRCHNKQKLDQSKPRGTLTVKDISLRLMRDFINGHVNYHNDTLTDQMMYYFIVLLRHEDTVHHTAMVTSDEGLQSGYVFFPNYIQIKSLPHDFTCILEVYALKTKRELYSQSATLKKPSKMPSFHQVYSSPTAIAAVIDPSFQKIGSLVLNIGNISKTKFHLVDVMSPLDGIVTMTLTCFPEEAGTIGHKGFLSLYQEVESIASWTRFWCVLNDGNLRFWKYPEDESKKPIVVVNLRDSANEEIKPLGVETCPYPHSMTIDIWVESAQKKGKFEKIRIMMAADTKEDMHQWLDVLNGSLRNITLWCPKR
uniref:PH domain-containing protein n=1 Tax=Syphacia muris TaxID=451379 RepID=A0A0N5A8J4_9BILA